MVSIIKPTNLPVLLTKNISLKCGTWFGGAKRKRQHELPAAINERHGNKRLRSGIVSSIYHSSSYQIDVERLGEPEEEIEDETGDDLSVFKNILVHKPRIQTQESSDLRDHMYTREKYDLRSLAQSMQNTLGICFQPVMESLKTQFGSRYHPNSLFASEFIDWLRNTFPNINSQAKAVELGNELMEDGLYRHVRALQLLGNGYKCLQYSRGLHGITVTQV